MSALRLGLLLVALSVAGPALARVPLPASVRDAEDWRLRGAGEMRFLGWRVYEAALWQSGEAQALCIRYDRSISGERLVQTTLEEMARLGVESPGRWREVLSRAFPDVAAGDVLVAERAGGGVQFYAGDTPTVFVDDAAFAAAFFAIWLDPRTREPDLRAALLGQGRP